MEGDTPSYPTTLRSRKFSRVGGHDPYPGLTYLEAKTRQGKTSHHRRRQQEHYQKVHGGCTVRVRGRRTGRRNRTGPKGSAAAARELNTTGWFNAREGQEGRKPSHIPGECRPHLARSQSCKLAVAQLGPRGGGGRVQAFMISVSSETISSATFFAKGKIRCTRSQRPEVKWSYLFCSFRS